MRLRRFLMTEPIRTSFELETLGLRQTNDFSILGDTDWSVLRGAKSEPVIQKVCRRIHRRYWLPNRNYRFLWRTKDSNSGTGAGSSNNHSSSD